MTTLLAIDIGNTNVSLGVFDAAETDAAELSHHWRIGTHRELLDRCELYRRLNRTQLGDAA